MPRKKTLVDAVSIRSNPPVNMSLAEAAVYVGVSQNKLWSEIHRPGTSLKSARVGRRIIIQRAALDRWLELSAITAAA